MQGTTAAFSTEAPGRKFQSTFPMQGTTIEIICTIIVVVISIHVPNAGNDSEAEISTSLVIISIHVPNAGNDLQS